MATIKEVAVLAGVSTSTVSRALSNKIPVEEATRRRVMDAVEQLGYRPNPLAKGLREGVSHTIALLLPDINNPFFPKLVKCVERSAQQRGYSLILCDSGNDEERELRHVENMTNHYVDGVLYVGVGDGLERARILIGAGVPFVMVNRSFREDFFCIANDNEHGAHTVVDYLVRMGHRRISCLIPHLNTQHYQERRKGCLRAFREHGITGHERLTRTGIVEVEDAYRATLELLAAPERPTAFFAFSDMLAIGVYSAAHSLGLRVPEDVSVAGFDNITISQHMIPPLTTYDLPVERIAEAAVECLLGQIGKNNAGDARTHQEIAGALIVRDSVADNNR